LQYWIYEPGEGAQVKENDLAAISYTITLLDGTVCYETTDANPKMVHVGHDNVETGLHEALQLMHVGDKARVILPSHLAFGLTGDSGKIPQNASVVYDLHLISAS
jgi:FKBP-type peptidyl-prolyl cis-trans isomerase FkpA